MIDYRIRGIQILLAVALLATLFVGASFYRANYTCSGLRDRLVDAKAVRNAGGFTIEQRRHVDDRARAARDHGCDVDDLVGNNVGQ